MNKFKNNRMNHLRTLGVLCTLVASLSLNSCAHSPSVPVIKPCDVISLTKSCKKHVKSLEEALLIGDNEESGFYRYHCLNGEPVGFQVTYFPDGKINRINTYNSNGQLEGMRITLYQDGSIEFVNEFKSGKLDGLSISWLYGKLFNVSTYVGGEQVGWDYYINSNGREFDRLKCYTEYSVPVSCEYCHENFTHHASEKSLLKSAKEASEIMKQKALKILEEVNLTKPVNRL